MSTGENKSELALILGREVGKLFSVKESEYLPPKFANIENIISQYMKKEANYAVVRDIQPKDVAGWKRTLSIYDTVSEVVFNLERLFPDVENAMQSFFDIKMIKVFLAGVIIRGSKMFREMEDRNKISINKDRFLEEDKDFKAEHFKLIEDFLRSPIPFVKEDEEGELVVDSKEMEAGKKEFFQKGELVYWYLIYQRALIQREKELNHGKEILPELDKKEEKVKVLMNEYVQHNKPRQFDSRGR